MGPGDSEVTVESHGSGDDSDVFRSLEASSDIDATHADLDGLDFRLGWVGWFSYEFGVRLAGERHARSPYPDAAFFFVDRAVVFDHATRTVSALIVVDDAHESRGARTRDTDWIGWLRTKLADLVRLAPIAASTTSDLERGAVVERDAASLARAVWRHSDHEYRAHIEECQRIIARGDAYQLCLTNTVTVARHGGSETYNPVETYGRLRKTSSSHHGGFIRMGDTSLLSTSPERFLRIDPNRVVETSPIKGTRARGQTREEDERLKRELRESPKEQAENLMIVDLTRNDLSRVCRVGSVVVTRLLGLETYPHVHQLVSTVQGALRPDASLADVLASTFPAGSMTGAPKRRAIRTLFDIEGGPRGIYSGTFGYVGIDGSVDLAMVIRSIVIDEAGATVGTGGGITSLSDPRDELDEAHLKARALLRALASARD